MTMNFRHVAECTVALAMMVGCAFPKEGMAPPATVGTETVPTTESAFVSAGSQRHWRVPLEREILGFLGTSLLTTTADKQTIQALDASGSVLWSKRLDSEIHGVLLRSDLSEALVRTINGYHWLELGQGQVLGEAPLTEPLIGDVLWHGEWLLVGVPVSKGPVDPKAPGRSYSHTEWTLYRSSREEKGWRRVGMLVPRGGNLATLSQDGKRALVTSQTTGEYALFEEGRRILGFQPGADFALMMLTPSGNHVVKRVPDGAAIYTLDGKLLAELPAPGNQVAVWGELAVLIDGNTFAVFNTSGREVFRQSGSVPREQYNARYLLVTGSDSRLLDSAGKPVIHFATQSPQMTPDGCWVYERDQQDFLSYALPGCD